MGGIDEHLAPTLARAGPGEGLSLALTELDGARAQVARLEAELTRLRAEHARDDEALHLLRDVIPHVVYTFDLDTLEAVYVNGHVEAVLGYPDGHLQRLGSNTLPALIHPADQQLVAESLGRWADARDGEWRDSELRVRHADGTWRWIQTRDAVLERGPDGHVRRLIGVLTDITERKQLETALARSQTLEAVGRLAGGIAHDFNNLLTVILGSVALAQRAVARREDPSGPIEQAGAVAREASRLTKNLLTFASREVGGPEVIDLAEEARNSLPILRRLVEGDVELTLQGPDAPTWVQLQRAQLTQILLNLVVNARDAMPRGGVVAITIAPARHQVEGGVERPGVRVRVADTGEGMAPETLRRMFDPFFTTKLPGKGTGLGLSTVYGIVRGRSGDVDVRSEEGQGTTIDVWLPSAPAPAPASRRPSSSTVAAVSIGTTVLVVEDNAPLAETCVAIFQGAGYRVLSAKDGVAALEVMSREGDRVTAVLSDELMPRLSGSDLAAKLARSHPRVRLVLWSGDPQRLGQPGGNVTAVLAKPIDPDTLLKAMARAVAAPR